MARHLGVARDDKGNTIPSPTVYVYDSGTTDLSSIYSDAALTTAESNPYTGDTDGSYEFYAPDGKYKIKVTKTGYADFEEDDVVIGSPVLTYYFSGVWGVRDGANTTPSLNEAFLSFVVPDTPPGYDGTYTVTWQGAVVTLDAAAIDFGVQISHIVVATSKSSGNFTATANVFDDYTDLSNTLTTIWVTGLSDPTLSAGDIVLVDAYNCDDAAHDTGEFMASAKVVIS